MPITTHKPLSWFKVNPQVRKTFDDVELRRLGASLRTKQLQPVLAQPDGTLIAGERRYRAAGLVGLETLDVTIADETLSAAQVKVWQLTENLQRADLTAHEKWRGCVELMALHPAWQVKDLAEHLHLDPSMVPRLLSPSKCSPAWQAALAAGEVGISECYAASKVAEPEQIALLELKRSGASRDAIERAGRKQRTAAVPAVKAARIRCELPGGVCVVVTGQAISLDEAIDALGEAVKEMKRARDIGYTAKTFAAAMKDKATKG